MNSKIAIWLAAGVAVAAMSCLFLVWLFFMHTEVVEPGTELVINDKPYFFGHEGVRPEPIREGRKLLFITSSATQVVKTPLSEQIAFDDYSSRDNILLDFHTTIQYRVTDSVTLVRDFGADWLKNNVLLQYASIVREEVKKHTMTDMMSDPNTATTIDRVVTDQLKQLVRDSKLPIEVLNVSLGRAKPNSNVLEQMNQTAAQQQRKKTLVEATAAEEQREKEQIAKARADNAYRNAMNLSPEQFVQLETVKRYSEACAKSTCVVDATGGARVMVTPAVK